MRKASTLVIFGTLLALAAGSAHALGFGRIGGSTTLGQQLNFSALVRLEADETLASECVSAEVTSGENKLGAGGVRVNVEPAANVNERILRVTTLSPLDEPVVTVTLTVGCSSRVSRKFVVFLDPPFINLAQTNAAEPPPPPVVAPAPEAPRAETPPATPSTQNAPIRKAASPASSQAARVVKPRPRAKTLTVNPSAAAAQAARAKKPAGTDTEVATRMPSTGARLKLEAPVPPAGARASESTPTSLAGAASAASQPASSASLEEQSQLVAKERERLKALEESLTRLRTETEATQKTLASLQTRLKGAESERFSNPLVYALAGLCAALVFAVAAMWRRYSLREAAWWATPQADGATTVQPRPSAPDAELSALPVEVSEAAASESMFPEPVARSSTPFSAAPDTLPLPAMSDPPSAAPPRRELSVEELIDLEQQAEFFVVLGQDEAAIDLLMGHLRSTGGSSPLPYLKLLEIYRRRGDSEAYSRTRERFNRRFNAYAPDWDSDPQQGRALEGYPEMVERLQALWSKPSQVLEVLDAALFRRDQSEDTFDVPAYRELVLLYSVVRDLAEHEGTAAAVVDLLLPIDAADEQPDSILTQPAPFVSTTEVSITELTAASRRPPVLDLDISAVRVFERPVDIEMPELGASSNFLGLVDDVPAKDKPRKS